MANTKNCSGCMYENTCDFITCKKNNVTNVTQSVEITEKQLQIIYAALMHYGNSLSEMAKKIPNEEGISSQLIDKSKDSWLLARKFTS